LEFTSHKSTPEMGVTNYANDDTQGPACAVACAPATVFRNYFAPLHDAAGADAALTGQKADQQINNLRDLSVELGNVDGKYYDVINGYVLSDQDRLEALRKRLDAFSEDMDKLRASVRIGLCYSSLVTFADFVPFCGFRPIVDAQNVSQVFSAAPNVRLNGTTPTMWEPFAKLLLETTYEAALWTTVLNGAEEGGKPVIMLTMVGGGVFGNSIDWITDAIRRAVNVLKEAGVPDLEVRVAHYGEIKPAIQAALADL